MVAIARIRRGKLLFPQDCSGLFRNLKRVFVESLLLGAVSAERPAKRFQVKRFQTELENPTELVVY
jgi:hypothetical protein